MKRAAILIALFSALNAGADDLEAIVVTYNSDPQGAVLYENGKRIGSMPFRARYSVTAADRASGWRNILPVEAEWTSGVRGPLNSTMKIPTTKGPELVATFHRPAGPGLELDQRVAADLARVNEMRLQAAHELQRAKQIRDEQESRQNRAAAAGFIGDLIGAAIEARRPEPSIAPPRPSPPIDLKCRTTGSTTFECKQ